MPGAPVQGHMHPQPHDSASWPRHGKIMLPHPPPALRGRPRRGQADPCPSPQVETQHRYPFQQGRHQKQPQMSTNPGPPPAPLPAHTCGLAILGQRLGWAAWAWHRPSPFTVLMQRPHSRGLGPEHKTAPAGGERAPAPAQPHPICHLLGLRRPAPDSSLPTGQNTCSRACAHQNQGLTVGFTHLHTRQSFLVMDDPI